MEELQIEALAVSRRVRGAEHPDTLTTATNLAATYFNLGQLAGAETLQVDTLDASRRVRGAWGGTPHRALRCPRPGTHVPLVG